MKKSINVFFVSFSVFCALPAFGGYSKTCSSADQEIKITKENIGEVTRIAGRTVGELNLKETLGPATILEQSSGTCSYLTEAVLATYVDANGKIQRKKFLLCEIRTCI